MKTFKIVFLITVAVILLFDIVFAAYSLSVYFLALNGKAAAQAPDKLCYAAIVLNALCAALIPLYFYIKKKSFYEN